ncbi:MAG: PAS domain S-box protein [Rhodanobacter sp.]
MRRRQLNRIAAGSPASWHAVVHGSAGGLLVLHPQGHILYANPVAAQWLGRSAEALVGSAFPYSLAPGQVVELKLSGGLGAPLSLEACASELVWQGQPALVVSLHNITERQRLQSLKNQRVKLLERMAQGASLAEVLRAVVDLVEGQFPQSICTVMLLDADGLRLRHGASTRLPQALIDAYEGAEIGPGRGSCGTAAFERRSVFVADIATDPLWDDWRELALRNGLQACWSVPIFSSLHHVVGTFATYHRSPHVPVEAEVELAEACAQIIGIAIERHRAETQLKLLETCVEHLNDLVVITEATPLDAPGPRIVFVNDAFLRLSGYRREEVLGQSPRMLQGPLTQRAELDRIRAALSAARPVRAELINYDRHGGQYWLELDITPIAGIDGRPTHFAAVERDITDYKRIETAMRESEQRFRIIAKATNDAIWDWNLLTGARWWSDGLQILFGHALADIEPGIESWTRRVHADDRERVLQGIHAVIDNDQQDWSDEYRFQRADGSYAEVLDRGFVIRDAGGQPLRMIGGMNDVSRRNQAEAEALRATEQLRLSAAEYRLLFEGNPHPMWVYEPATLRVMAVNDAAIEHYGFSREEFLAMRLPDLRPAEDVPRLLDKVSRSAVGLHSGDRWRHRRKDGSLIDVEISAGDIVFEGNPARLVLASDISERVQAERELARIGRADRMLSRCNEALVHAETEQELLDAVCRIGVETGGYPCAWVGYAMDDEAHSIKQAAHCGSGSDYLQQIQLSWSADQPQGQGPAGRTIRSGAPVLVEDIEHDMTFVPWASSAMQHGFHAIGCLPLRDAERTFGFLCFYAGAAQPFLADEFKLLQELADNLAYGIDFIRSRVERQRMHAAVARMATAVSSSAGEGFFEQMVLAMAEAVGADAAFIMRWLPGDPQRVQTLAVAVNGRLCENFAYALDGTPCGGLLGEPVGVVTDHLPARFAGFLKAADIEAQAYAGRRFDSTSGESLGSLCVLYREPLRKIDFIVSTLGIFAARAAAELERQRADAHIHEQASLLDKAHNAIIVRNLDGRITYWNQGAERIYGWPADEALGRINPDDNYNNAELLEDIKSVLLRDGEWTGRLDRRRRDGTPMTVEAHATLIRDAHGTPQSMLSIINDITPRVQMEQRLQRSERLEAIGQLTGGVAHDFNNLLTVMLGNAEILVEKLAGQPRLLELAEMTRTAAVRGADLTHRLLAFARRQPLEPTAVQVNALISSINVLLRRTLGGQVEIETIQAAGLWEALVDAAQLEGALLNLCLNARDAMADGGRLTIESANVWIDQAYADQYIEVKPGQYVLVAVSDTGSGIAAEHLERVFEPFFTTKEAGKGTGLGLSMVYGFVKQSHGHIKIYSEPGQGSTIKMYLPRAMQGDRVQPTRGISAPEVRGHEVILLVEDDELVRRYAEDLLGGLGYRVITARNGAQAMEALRQHPDIDLLFTDVMMPGNMNGRQLADAALALRPGLRVLYTSGYTENAIIHHGRLDPGIHLLNKPYTRVALARKLRAALGESAS